MSGRVLTLDLGTSATKAAVWSQDGQVASSSVPVATRHPRPGWAEQDPDDWWESVVAAVRRLSGHLEGVAGVGLCGARETFVPVREDLTPVGPGILWSDRRAAAQAADLSDRYGAEALRLRSGVVFDAGVMAAKVAWLAAEEPERLSAARWLLSPRDLVAARLTGAVVTDRTMASKTGFASESPESPESAASAELAALAGGRLPPALAPDAVAGTLTAAAANALAVAGAVPVVIGAGDRASEVLGTGATPEAPMVSWGTTANVSLPVSRRPASPPTGTQVTAAAPDGWLVEAGLSASGSALAWLAELTGADPSTLLSEIERSEPGARGVLALPWLNGARAPWWRPAARAAFLGLTAAHGRADLARAVVEGVALDVARCVEVMAPGAVALNLAGGGSAGAAWRSVVSAACRRPVRRRALADAAGAGACVLAGRGIGMAFDLDRINPPHAEDRPDPDLERAYTELRRRADPAAALVAGLTLE